jgi:hypothetical protein
MLKFKLSNIKPLESVGLTIGHGGFFSYFLATIKGAF